MNVSLSLLTNKRCRLLNCTSIDDREIQLIQLHKYDRTYVFIKALFIFMKIPIFRIPSNVFSPNMNKYNLFSSRVVIHLMLQ